MHIQGEDKDLRGISQVQYHWWDTLLSGAGAFLTYSQFWTYFAVDSSSVQWLVIPYCDQWDGIHCCLSTYPFATESENEPYTTCVMSIRILKLSPAHGYLCMPKASEQHEQKQPNGHSTLCKIKYYLKNWEISARLRTYALNMSLMQFSTIPIIKPTSHVEYWDTFCCSPSPMSFFTTK